MGKAIFAVLGLVVGLVTGTVFGGSLLTGAATGVGIATGLSAGICATVAAARSEGLLIDEEIAQVLTRATTDMGGTVPKDTLLVNSADECDDLMNRLHSSGAD